MKPKVKRNIFVITPQDGGGYLIDYYENEKVKHAARYNKKQVLNFLLTKLPASHIFYVTDMGEVR